MHRSSFAVREVLYRRERWGGVMEMRPEWLRRGRDGPWRLAVPPGIVGWYREAVRRTIEREDGAPCVVGALDLEPVSEWDMGTAPTKMFISLNAYRNVIPDHVAFLESMVDHPDGHDIMAPLYVWG